jgi:hypothetical protein
MIEKAKNKPPLYLPRLALQRVQNLLPDSHLAPPAKKCRALCYGGHSVREDRAKVRALRRIQNIPFRI